MRRGARLRNPTTTFQTGNVSMWQGPYQFLKREQEENQDQTLTCVVNSQMRFTRGHLPWSSCTGAPQSPLFK